MLLERLKQKQLLMIIDAQKQIIEVQSQRIETLEKLNNQQSTLIQIYKRMEHMKGVDDVLESSK